MPVAVYRVVDRHSRTVAEYVAGPVGTKPGYQRALKHAAEIGGRVFYIDHDGYLTLVFGARDATAA